MKNITFSADERLIEQARNRALRDGCTLNQEFRRWLADYALQEGGSGGSTRLPGSCGERSGSGVNSAGTR